MRWPSPMARHAGMIAATMTVATAVSFSAGWYIRNSVITTFSQEISISNARRHVDDLRVAQHDETHSLMRFVRSAKLSDLEIYRSHPYDGISSKTINALKSAGAIGAAEPLVDAAEIHRGWINRTDAALAHVVQSPKSGAKIAYERHAVVADFEHTNDAMELRIGAARARLDERDGVLRQQISAEIPRWVTGISFIAVLFAAAGGFALVISLQFIRERARVDRLLQAFRGVELPIMPLAVFDGVLAPVSRADRVGGDWYDVRMLPDGLVFMTIGDVAGHGVNAAVSTAQMRRTLLGAAIGRRDPAEVLSHVNNEHALGDHAHVATLCAFYDPQTRELRYASAGLPAPLVREPGGTRFLSYGGPPLGALANYRYESHTERLVTDAVLVLYTDGLLEHAHDTVLGETLLRSVARKIYTDTFAHRLYHALFNRRTQLDDVAILTLHVKPA